MRLVGAVLRSFTVRGRGFLTSGATATACGIALLERDLVRVGLVVLLLPLVAGAALLLRRPSFEVHRRTSPDEVTAGAAATVSAVLTSTGRRRTPLVLEERLPALLGREPRFVLPPDDQEQTRLDYPVSPALRGRFTVGPLRVRQRDPFGLVETRREVGGTDEVLVLPHLVELDPIRLDGRPQSTGEERPRSASSGSAAASVVRAYRRGDDLRRVHWPSTARVGELMVRHEEQLWQPRATVLLDHRTATHRGRGPGSTLETAVCATASVLTHLARRGYLLRLVTGSGTWRTDHDDSAPGRVGARRGVGSGGEPVGDLRGLLEHLAVLEADPRSELPSVEVDDDLAGDLVVGVVGVGAGPVDGSAEPVADARWWGRFPTAAGSALALVPGTTAPPTWLARQGWRAAALGDGSDLALAAAWQRLEAVTA